MNKILEFKATTTSEKRTTSSKLLKGFTCQANCYQLPMQNSLIFIFILYWYSLDVPSSYSLIKFETLISAELK